MTDWKKRGKIAELRYRQFKHKLGRWKALLGLWKCKLQLRYIGWKYEKLQTLDLLAESYGFQHGDSDE